MPIIGGVSFSTKQWEAYERAVKKRATHIALSGEEYAALNQAEYSGTQFVKLKGSVIRYIVNLNELA